MNVTQPGNGQLHGERSGSQQERPRRAHFWVVKVTASRVAPIMILGGLTWNPFGYSWWDWAVRTATSVPDLATSSRLQQEFPYGFLVTSAVMVLIWSYVLREAWRGLGSKVWPIVIVGSIVGLSYAWLDSIGWAPQGVLLESIVCVVLYGAIGFSFCLTLIDRWLSGVGTAVTYEGEDHR